MTVEERGQAEELVPDASSAELPPSESTEADAPAAESAATEPVAEAESAAGNDEPIAEDETVSESPAVAEESGTEDGSDEPATDEEEAPAAIAPAPKKQPAEEAKYKRGQVYSGVISSTAPTAVTVDLGDGDQGIVPGRELELMTRKMLESLVVGAEVDVYVVNPRNHRGETVLSINHALEELDWRNAQKLSKVPQGA